MSIEGRLDTPFKAAVKAVERGEMPYHTAIVQFHLYAQRCLCELLAAQEPYHNLLNCTDINLLLAACYDSSSVTAVVEAAERLQLLRIQVDTEGSATISQVEVAEECARIIAAYHNSEYMGINVPSSEDFAYSSQF